MINMEAKPYDFQRLLMSRTGDVLLNIDAHGNLLQYCENFQKNGLSADSFLNKNIIHIVDQNQIDIPSPNHFIKLLHKNPDLIVPLKSNTSDLRWGKLNLLSGIDEHLLLHIRDITQQKCLEKELLNSTAEWTHAMDSFEDPVYILDLDERVVRVNQAFYRLKNLTPDQVIGKKITDIMHPHGEEIPCPVCVARAQRRDTYITMEADHPNNVTGRPFEIMVRTIRNQHGEAIGTLMSNRDLTRARQTENELQRLNNHVGLLMESTGEGIFGIDNKFRCTFVNRAAAKMLGYTQDELIGKDMFDLIHHSYEDGRPYPREKCLIQRALNEQIGHWSDDDVLWEKHNISFPVQYRANPIFVDQQMNGAVVVFRNVTASRAMAQQMDYLARHDYLTGLFNRLEFEGRLSTLIESARIDGVEHVLCYIDLDQFKVVNDTCGHVAGDLLLKKLSQSLKQVVGNSDILARIGGDEFAILLSNRNLESANSVIERLFQEVNNFRFFSGDKVFTIGLSVGVVAINATSGDLARILAAADSACYLAKESGRNRAHIFEENDQAQVKRHREIQWVSRLKKALNENRIQLYCQKITPARSTETDLIAIEILMRIEDEDENLILPGSFISAAERYDLMPILDRLVLENVFNWIDSNFDHPAMQQIDFFTINLSGLSVTQHNFLEFLKSRLAQIKIATSKICFEITETAAISNLASAQHFMSELKAIGCRFALDDFGSGMSSFAYLKNLPVEFLKIDGNFILDIVNDPVDNAMVKAINEVGHVMGLKTIAEYVEDDEISEELINIGVDYLQGYKVGVPQPLYSCFND